MNCQASHPTTGRFLHHKTPINSPSWSLGQSSINSAIIDLTLGFVSESEIHFLLTEQDIPNAICWLMQGNWFCLIVILTVVSLTMPHTVIQLTHRRGRIFSMAGAVETWSHSRQMRHMSPLGDSRSYHGWSVLLANNEFFKFSMK